MQNKWWVVLFFQLAAISMCRAQTISTHYFQINFPKGPGLFSYRLEASDITLRIDAPVLEIDNKEFKAMVSKFTAHPMEIYFGNVHQQVFEGPCALDPSIRLAVTFRWTVDNPMVRFCYTLSGTGNHLLTKAHHSDALHYLSTHLPAHTLMREIQLSNFNQINHANNLQENTVDSRYWEDEATVMGPLLEITADSLSYVMAYEHGSQYPDRFLEFAFSRDSLITLRAVKGNYIDHQPLGPGHEFKTIWLELGGIKGNENDMASAYRKFMLNDLSPNLESRKPYIFYNTWGRQERTKWSGGAYLGSMNLQTTLREIEIAHQMGIEVYVLDAGWFLKTGDWMVNTRLFPDTLKEVKQLLNKYNMKLGLWFNPLAAAVTSKMLAANKGNVMTWNGKAADPEAIWETEPSVLLSLVSPYWEEYADKLITLVKQLGVTYFKWDAVGQYGSNDPGHFNGTAFNTARERSECYAFQLPLYMSKVIDKVCIACPEAIFDFDITESGRSVGLAFLSSGKYFIMNNGPYYDNYDLGGTQHTPLANGNVNIFVNPGPARGWFIRSVLTYDKWIPSILFLTHYQPDEPENSQVINMASLILGQNGIWGELLKVSPAGIQLIHNILEKYKTVRNDILISDPVMTGKPGNSPEIYEKINPANGKGAVVVFANAPGNYDYITLHKADTAYWSTEGVTVRFDEKGRAVIRANFESSSARIIFFGTR